MKKLLSVLLILALVSASLIGCSANKKTVSQKSEEELRAEIKAEMEAEEKKKEALREELKAEQKAEEEKITGPINMAIKNYNGEGLERLAKLNLDLKGKYILSGKEVSETLAIFGEVTNVRIGDIRLFTEGNYALLEKFDSLKDTELTIKRGSSDDRLIAISFYDQGFKEHVFEFTSSKNYLKGSEAKDKQELTTGLEEKDKATTAYKNRSDVILKSLAEKKFVSSNIFNNIQEIVDDFDGSKYYQVENEPLGYNFNFYKSYYRDGDVYKFGDDIREVYISPNEDYNSMKDESKCSFFGVDFDMSIYQARYNMSVPKDKISIELVEHYEEKGKLMGIRVTKESK